MKHSPRHLSADCTQQVMDHVSAQAQSPTGHMSPRYLTHLAKISSHLMVYRATAHGAELLPPTVMPHGCIVRPD